jgi:hypothetical protein
VISAPDLDVALVWAKKATEACGEPVEGALSKRSPRADGPAWLRSAVLRPNVSSESITGAPSLYWSGLTRGTKAGPVRAGLSADRETSRLCNIRAISTGVQGGAAVNCGQQEMGSDRRPR